MKKWMALAALVAVVAMLAACGAGRSVADAVTGQIGGMAEDSVGVVESSMPEYAAMPAADADMVPGESAQGLAGGGAAAAAADGRKITFSASLNIETKQFDKDYASIVGIVEEAGGYVASENSHAGSGAQTQYTARDAWLSARVPADGFDGTLDTLGAVGNVTNRTKSSEALRSQYFDTEARIEMLELRKDRLMEYLVTAEDAADIVAFEQELSQVLYDLDQYQGEKRRLDSLVDYATVDIYLQELVTPETIDKDGEPLGDRASDAFGVSAKGVKTFLENVLVWLAGAVPVLLLIAAIIVVIRLIVVVTRKARLKYREKHPKKEKPAPQPPTY